MQFDAIAGNDLQRLVSHAHAIRKGEDLSGWQIGVVEQPRLVKIEYGQHAKVSRQRYQQVGPKAFERESRHV